MTAPRVATLLALLAAFSLSCGTPHPGQSKGTLGSATAEAVAAPPAGALPNWTFPRAERVRLNNGLRLVILERAGLGLLQLRLVVSSGSGSDGPAPGVAALTAKWLSAGGTANSSSRELIEHVEALGASLDVSTTHDATVLSIATPSEHFDDAIALVATVAREPRFSPSEFEKLREREIERVTGLAHGDGPWIATMALYSELFRGNSGRHPYARFDSLPSDLAQLQPADAQAWYVQNFSPKNAFLVISGEVSVDDAKRSAELTFGTWQGEEVAKATFSATQEPRSRRIALVRRRGSAVSELRLAALGPERRSPRWSALRVASQILGGTPNGRLSLKRETTQLFAALHPSLEVDELAHGPSLVVVGAAVLVTQTGTALTALLEDLKAISEKAATSDELSASTRELSMATLLDLETNSSTAELLARAEILALGDEYSAHYGGELARVSLRDVRAAATEYLGQIRATVVVGDADRLVTPLSHFGQVDVIDPENNFRVERVVNEDPTASVEIEDAEPEPFISPPRR